MRHVLPSLLSSLPVVVVPRAVTEATEVSVVPDCSAVAVRDRRDRSAGSLLKPFPYCAVLASAAEPWALRL